MSTVVDKSQAGLTARQYHVGLEPGEVSSVALLPGDPFRVPLVAEFLTDVREVAWRREHRTMTGWYKERLITATSTGMGCPSTAIAVEELARVGVRSTDAYLPKGFPAVPDLELTTTLARHASRIAEAAGTRSHTGISVSDDAFYAETPEWIGELNRMGILNVEMEASAL